MVSSGSVQNSLNAFQNLNQQSINQLEGLEGSWNGPAYLSLIPHASATLEDFSGSISAQFENYASACRSYEDYIVQKKNRDSYIEAAQKNADALRANPRARNRASIEALIQDCNTKAETCDRNMQRLREQILSALSAASSPKLEATAVNASVSSSLLSSANVTGLMNLMESDIGKTIADFGGLGFHNGAWCADWVSYKLQQSGYEFNPSAACGQLNQNLQAAGWTSYSWNSGYNPQPGDVVFFDWNGNHSSYNHVEIVVESGSDGSFMTIGGNTTGNGSEANPSSCVALKKRNLSQVTSFATPTQNT